MRNLGIICLESKLPHIRQACKIEMIARSAKVVILEACSQYILRLKAVREGDDITLPLSIIHEKVR